MPAGPEAGGAAAPSTSKAGRDARQVSALPRGFDQASSMPSEVNRFLGAMRALRVWLSKGKSCSRPICVGSGRGCQRAKFFVHQWGKAEPTRPRDSTFVTSWQKPSLSPR